ncbi:MAG: CoA-transferase subunit beta [Polyangiaceae bacterium]
MSATLDEVCAVAIAECFRGDGEILCSPIGTLPAIGARLAKLTFEPGLLMTDGVAPLVANVSALGDRDAAKVIEGWLPYRSVFDLVWHGRRHVMMGATQIDRYGNQNIACIGDFEKPKAQLLGMRGAPGNTICHPTSYWVPKHSRRVFVEQVDVVSGVGYDRARALGERASRFHEIRRVISNLGVFDFETPDNRMRLVSAHPGVEVSEIVENTGFELVLPQGDVPRSRQPGDAELELLRTRIDPRGFGKKELGL